MKFRWGDKPINISFSFFNNYKNKIKDKILQIKLPKIKEKQNTKNHFGFITGIIGLAIGIIVFSNIFISISKNVNTTSFNKTESVMWNLLTLIGIVGLVYAVLAVFGLAGGKI